MRADVGKLAMGQESTEDLTLARIRTILGMYDTARHNHLVLWSSPTQFTATVACPALMLRLSYLIGLLKRDYPSRTTFLIIISGIVTTGVYLEYVNSTNGRIR